MSTLSYLNYDDIGALKDFISNISKLQILWTKDGAILLRGLNFQRLIFLKGTKKADAPGSPDFC